MKKVLAAAVSTALLLGGAAVASAEIDLDGFVRHRGFTEKTRGVKDITATTAYDTKAALGVKGKLSDAVTGYLRLEVGNGSSDVYSWGEDNNQALQQGGAKDEASEMELQQAWIDYKPSFWGVKVGHQPLALGEKLFFDHIASGDDAINLYGDLAGTMFNLITIKLQENGNADNSADLDAYVLNLSRKFGPNFSGNVNWTYLDGGSENDAADEFPGLAMHNLGVVASLKFGDINITADIEKQFGTAFDDGTTEVDAAGLAAQVSATYQLANTSLGLLAAMGSGDDTVDDENETFVTFLTDKPYQVYIPGYRVAVPGAAAVTNANGRFTGLSNLTIVQANAKTAMNIGKPLSLFGSLSYLKLTEDVNNESDLGIELDVVAALKLTSNLTYKVEIAYLFADDAWGNDADDKYFLRHGLSLSF